MKFAWIEGHKGDWPLSVTCGVLGVTRAGYYAWRDRPASDLHKRREELTESIRLAHERSRGTYGSPRVYKELKALGVSCCENTVAKVMKEEQIRSKVVKPFRVKTTDSSHTHPVAKNVLDRDFEAKLPDQKWVVDITYIHTDEGVLYLAGVMDLCSRKIVGWQMSDHMRADLCLDALKMALKVRKPGDGLLHHSDRGSQYACCDYRQLLESNGIACSMSRTGNCHDNAPMESFWGTLKTERVYHEHYRTHEQARQSIFEYIECWYNRKRRHSALDYKSPEQFEADLN